VDNSMFAVLCVVEVCLHREGLVHKGMLEVARTVQINLLLRQFTVRCGSLLLKGTVAGHVHRLYCVLLSNHLLVTARSLWFLLRGDS